MNREILQRNISVWWHGIDKKTLCAILILKALGLVLIAAAGPASSERIGASQMHFLNKQLIYIIAFTPLMLVLSALPHSMVKRLILTIFVVSMIFMMLLPLFGQQHKGAKRWIYIFSFCLQPSEFLKASYIFFIAIALQQREADNHVLYRFFGVTLTNYSIRVAGICILHCFVMLLLLLQPDFGMALTISFIVACQFFATGIRWRFIICIAVFACILCAVAIFTLPHVASRVESFLNKEYGVGYQVQKSLTSYEAGGLYGVGLGEGRMKYQLPDSHCDFIFAVAGEELGGIFCSLVVLILIYIFHNGLSYSCRARHSYQSLTIVGIHMWIAFQSIFNIGVTLNVLPTKGINLPFISYGGSALLSFDIAMGMYFNICREINLMKNRQRSFHAKY